MKTPTPFKTLLFLVLLVAAGGFGQQAKAQYQSFFGDSITEYNIAGDIITYSADYDPNWLMSWSYDKYVIKSDTVSINGMMYYRVRTNMYIREDTTQGRIYRYEHGQDWLICDMSLSVGDTFWMPSFDVAYVPDETPVPIIADSIFYINGLKNIIFKRIYYDEYEQIPVPFLWRENFHGKSIMFIEGIGPNFGPLGWDDCSCGGPYLTNGAVGFFWEPNPFLLCVHKDREMVFMSDERAGCWQSQGKVVENENPLFTLSPNPVHGTLNIKFKNTPLQQGNFYITDLAGRVVYSQPATTQFLTVNIKKLQSGPYVATWISGGKKSSVKFIKK